MATLDFICHLLSASASCYIVTRNAALALHGQRRDAGILIIRDRLLTTDIAKQAYNLHTQECVPQAHSHVSLACPISILHNVVRASQDIICLFAVRCGRPLQFPLVSTKLQRTSGSHLPVLLRHPRVAIIPPVLTAGQMSNLHTNSFGAHMLTRIVFLLV